MPLVEWLLRMSFQRHLGVKSQCFHGKQRMAVTLLNLNCFWRSRPRTAVFTEYASVPFCFRESELNVPSQNCLFPGQAARWKLAYLKWLVLSNVGGKSRAVLHYKTFWCILNGLNCSSFRKCKSNVFPIVTAGL